VYGFSYDYRHTSVSGRLMAALSLLALVGGCDKPQGTAAMAETPSGRALRWPKREIVLTPSPETRGGKPPAQLGRALASAAMRWNRALDGCGAPRLLANREVLKGPLIQDDLVNAVLLHEKRWCPPASVQHEDCHPADLTGRTHLYPRLAPHAADDGELAGADIEINGVGQPWAGVSPTPEAELRLEAILVHELGHVLGLDHPCGTNLAWSRAGKDLKPCGTPAMQDQVMHPSWAATIRGTDMAPSKAEVAAVCAVYARGA
jgi:hypothetical protein